MKCEALDLAESDRIKRLIAGLRPDLVVNAAAYSFVDQAERDPLAAWSINTQAVGSLAESCALAGARLVHYSTDYVFSGQQSRPWREEDVPKPLNVYGASKLAGEEAIRASGCRHMVFRIAWLYAAHSQNFLRTMIQMARDQTPIRVVDDQHGTPTHARWVAETTAMTLSNRPEISGTWHMSPTGRTTWFGFASEIFRRAVATGVLDQAPTLIAVDSSQFPTTARRPAWSVLDNTKLQRDFGVVPPDWRVGIADALKELAANEARERNS